MEDNVEEPAGMGVPSSAAVKADPDEVAESGFGGGGIVEDMKIIVRISGSPDLGFLISNLKSNYS